jgi:hypothetical protein
MALANSRVVKDEQTNQDCAPAAIEAYRAEPDDKISLGMIPLRKGRHLDVDKILARSLPKALGE